MPPEPPIVEKRNNWKKYLWIGLAVFVVLGALYSYGAYIDKQVLVQQKQQPIDNTSGWQTYRNEEYGFEFKYPPRLEIQAKYEEIYDENRWRVGDINRRSADLWLVFEFDFYTVSEQETNKFISNYFKPEDIIEERSSHDSVYISWRGNPGHAYFKYLSDANKMLVFEAGKEYLGSDEFRQILSTFRFIEPHVEIKSQIRSIVEKAVLKDTYRNQEGLKKIKLLSIQVEAGNIILDFNSYFFDDPQWTNQEGIPWDTTLGVILDDLKPTLQKIKTQIGNKNLSIELLENGEKRDGMLIDDRQIY